MFLEALTGCDAIPGFEGMWMVAKMPGQTWAETLRFSPERVAEADKIRSYTYKESKLTREHAEYMAVLLTAVKKNDGQHWSITIIDGDLRDPVMQAATAFHESAHLRLGYKGSIEDEAACSEYADAEMVKLFGSAISDEISKRREAGKSCMSIPGLEAAAKRMQGPGRRQAVRDYGLLLEGILAIRAK